MKEEARDERNGPIYSSIADVSRASSLSRCCFLFLMRLPHREAVLP